MPVGEDTKRHWCVPGEHWWTCTDQHSTPCREKNNLPCHTHKGYRSLKPSEKEAMAKSIVTDEDRYIPHITEVPDLADCLPAMIDEYKELQEAITEAEDRRKELNGEIKALMRAVGIRAVKGDSWVATQAKSTIRRTLSPEKLLMNGVEMDVIEASYDEKEIDGALSVRRL